MTFGSSTTYSTPRGGSSSYEQCVSVEGPDDDPFIRWNWEWPESDTLVSFPEIVVGYKPWDDPPARSDYPVSVGSFDATAYFDADIHAQGNYNVSFDIWCVDSDRPVVSSITHEVMIWLENSSLVPFGEKTATVSLGQVEYELWIAESHPDITGRTSHRWTYIAFVPVSEGTVRKVGLDLSLFFDYLTQNGYMPGSTKIASVELGTQIMSGTGSVTVSGFRIDMQ
ncbi:MAG: GH12 family glycosyl hydrolase domain-containing protein [Spirochaetota bacterium]